MSQDRTALIASLHSFLTKLDEYLSSQIQQTREQYEELRNLYQQAEVWASVANVPLPSFWSRGLQPWFWFEPNHVRRSPRIAQWESSVRNVYDALVATTTPVIKVGNEKGGDDTAAYMSAGDIAKKYGVPQAALEKRLERWRSKHKLADGWFENPDAPSQQPRYLYQIGAVQDIITELQTKH